MRNTMGSWRFVFLFLLFMGVWAALNTWAGTHHWDEYPFILLNLFLSMLAGLQGAILLIAAKRADALSAAMAEHDFKTNVAAKEEIESLMSFHRQQLKRLDEIVAILESTHGHPKK